MSRLGGSGAQNVMDKTAPVTHVYADRDSKQYMVPGMRRGHVRARVRRNWNKAKKLQLPGFFIGFLTAAWLGLAHRPPPVVVKKVVKKKPKPSLTIEELPDGYGVPMIDGPKAPDPTADAGKDNEEIKLVLVVNDELGMSAGKIAAQCSHATLAVYQSLGPNHRAVLKRWESEGQKKIALKCRTTGELRKLAEASKARGIPYYAVEDAGRTQVAAGSCTVIAIGPAPESAVNTVTGALRLL